MRNEMKDTTHQFDIWHVGRNIKKKLSKAARKKSNSELNNWIKAIINHFWWCCASCNENALELKEKWTSILYHITDRHHWENAKIYKRCQHNKLTKEERSCKPFLVLRSPAYQALEKVVLAKGLIADLCT